jgi:hypothetical protein
MDVKEQRTKIAEACGWKDCGYHHLHGMSWACVVLSGLRPEDNSSTYYCPLLDYLSDLNAMHEAWLSLSWENKFEFASALHEIVQKSYDRQVSIGAFHELSPSWQLSELANATAAQRAEAFLRTLNLWDDSK